MSEHSVPDFTSILAAAGRALGKGVRLDSPKVLQDSRAAVLRARVAEAGERTDLAATVVVKAHHAHEPFLREVAGLRLMAELDDPADPVAVGILAWASDPELVVLPDLGEGDRLAEHLLRGDPRAAQQAWLEWATGLATIAVRAPNPRHRLAELYAEHGSEPLPDDDPVASLTELAESLGVDCADEIATVAAVLADQRFHALTPSDACPDNHLLTEQGIRFLDFEFAQIRSLFLDAAYGTAPFPTCWGCYAAPDQVFGANEAAYRRRIIEGYPELADDQVWEAGMKAALASWAGMVALRSSGSDPGLDLVSDHDGITMPTWRARGGYITARAVARIESEFPKLAALVDRAVREGHARAGITAEPMLVYPAFRGEGSPGPS